MKYILFLLLSSILFADVANIILKIKYIETKNIKKKFLNFDYNIFGNNFLNKPEIVNNININTNTNLKIFAIFNNKVNINGKWFSLGDYINGYKIIKITSNGVYLMKKSKIIYLKLVSNNILKVK